jgi:peptide/nickel transport system substrate-binding protein
MKPSSSRRRIMTAAVAAAAVMTLTLTGCGGGQSPSPSGDKTTLTAVIGGQPKSLNPAEASNGITFVTDLAYASLIDVDANGELVPGLATAWEYVGDTNTEFKITLRDGVTFSDGTPLDAEAVAASINYFKTGNSATAGAFVDITAAADGTSTVVVTSVTPNPIMPLLFTPNYLGGDIIAPAGVSAPDALANKTLGAGPYILDSGQTVAGDHYTFVPNEKYWDQDAIHWEKVVLKVITSTTSAVQALNTGQVDFVMGDVNTESAAKQGNNNILSAPLYWNGVFILDRDGTVVPALKDLRVRQAMNYAIDREGIVQAIYKGEAAETDQPETPGWDAYDSSLDGTYPYDVDKAKALMKEAGYEEGFTVAINYGASPDSEPVVQAVAAQLAEIGITLELRASGNDYATDLYSLKYPLTSLPFGGQPQFANATQAFLDKGSLNPFNAVDPELKKLFDVYAAAPVDDSDQQAKVVEKYIVDQALSLPIAVVNAKLFVSKTVDGMTLLPTGYPSNIRLWTPAS